MTTAIADDRGRVRIPGAKPGQVFAIEADGAKVTLSPVQEAEPPTRMLRLVTQEGRLVADTTGLVVEPEAIARAVREERDR